MEETIRINTTLDGEDKYVTVNLNQTFDQLEILSLTVDQEDIYTLFNSDVGVVVGRVIANGGVGVPNAKISVFIPISEEDSNNQEIVERYPFENTRDIGPDGKRYNLLPAYREYTPKALDNVRGVFQNRFGVGLFPKIPVGTLPTRLDIVSNNAVKEVYEKYYKYTTTTNESGDYILYGIPTGVQTFHLDVDLSNIGAFSITPTDLIAQGYSPNLFNDGTFAPCDDLDTCIQVESQDLTTDVRPLWGDADNFEIGITRLDFRLRKELRPSFTFYSSVLSMNRGTHWGDVTTERRLQGNRTYVVGYESSNYSRIQGGSVGLEHNGAVNYSGSLNALSPLDSYYSGNCISISAPPSTGFTYDLSKVPKTFIGTFENLNVDIKVISAPLNRGEQPFQVPQEEIQFLQEPGQFVVRVPCNKRKKITDEFGNLIPTTDEDIGIFTEFEGYFLVTVVEQPDQPKSDDISFRCTMKIPASNDNNEVAAPFVFNTPTSEIVFSENILKSLREEYALFEFGKFYSCAQRFGNNIDRQTNKYGLINTLRDVREPLSNCQKIDRVGAINIENFQETINLTQNSTNNFPNTQYVKYEPQLYDSFVNMTMFSPNFIYRFTNNDLTPYRYSPYAALRIENIGSLEWVEGVPVDEFISNPIQFETRVIETPIEDIIRLLEMSVNENLVNVSVNKSTVGSFFNVSNFNNSVIDVKNVSQQAKRKKLFGNYVSVSGDSRSNIDNPIDESDINNADRFYFFFGLGEVNVLRFLLLKKFI